MKITLKSRKIGNSVGVILPKKLGIKPGEELSTNDSNGKLVIDLQHLLAEKRGKMIEDSFKDLDHCLNEKQMEARFGKYGWGK